MSNLNRALLVLGAIGALLYTIVRWTNLLMTIPGEVWLLFAFTSYVLMILGVLAFYRKSGNPIHILTVLVMLVHTATVHFLHMLWVIDPVAFPWVDTASI
ncbi:MAG: hypothetical protein ACE5H4_05005 [Candidatus Thorarchaeota archaeon]